MISLDLRELKIASRLSPAFLGYCSEAASVVLWRLHAPARAIGTWRHEDPAAGVVEREIELLWREPPPEVLEFHANEPEATEHAAYAVALAAADALGFHILRRATHRSGSDWIMAPKGEPKNDYYGLEASGMALVGPERAESRLAEKVAQGMRGQFRRPGVAVVARFEDVRVLSEAWR